jgi:hypothetical protein
MIVNVKNGKDVITLDFQLNQIRYCRNLARHGKIEFLDQSSTTMDCFKLLYALEGRESFFKSLAEDVGNDVRIEIDPTKLKVITDQEYKEMFK